MRTQEARVAYSPNHHGLHKDEPSVGWSTLATLVKGLVKERESINAPQLGAKGKSKRGGKRRASPSASEGPAAKKRKAEDGSSVAAVPQDHQPVFCLRYRLGYKLRDDDDVPSGAQALCDLFEKHGYGGDEDVTLQLPEVIVQPRPRGARLRRAADNEYLMYLPPPSQG